MDADKPRNEQRSTTPIPSSKLTSATITFDWGKGTNDTAYKLTLGTTAGGSNLFNTYTQPASAASATVNNLPTNGKTIYATLYSEIGGVWQSNAYTFTAAEIPAALTAPTPSSTLAGSSVTFTWNKGIDATAYKLTLGTTAGGSDLFNTYTQPASATSATVNNLPTNGKTIYATLYSEIGGVWQSNAYTFTAK